jgi:hypothetical protein
MKKTIDAVEAAALGLFTANGIGAAVISVYTEYWYSNETVSAVSNTVPILTFFLWILFGITYWNLLRGYKKRSIK